jgi:hypothetical protein
MGKPKRFNGFSGEIAAFRNLDDKSENMGDRFLSSVGGDVSRSPSFSLVLCCVLVYFRVVMEVNA